MLGAYTTFVVQELIRTRAPGLFDYSLAIAIPLAFLVAALVGMAIERGVIRFLYGRPLEDAARHLGHQPDPAAGGAHLVRAEQSRGRRAQLHVRRVRAGRPHHHLEIGCGSSCSPHHFRRPAGGGCATPSSACRCAP